MTICRDLPLIIVQISFCGAIEMAGEITIKFSVMKAGMEELGTKSPVRKPKGRRPVAVRDYIPDCASRSQSVLTPCVQTTADRSAHLSRYTSPAQSSHNSVLADTSTSKASASTSTESSITSTRRLRIAVSPILVLPSSSPYLTSLLQKHACESSSTSGDTGTMTTRSICC